MKTFFYRHSYLLIALIPLAIYTMSYCLFEINAASSLKIKMMIVAAIKANVTAPSSALVEYKSRILWLSSSLLSITAYLIALIWSVIIISRCCCRSNVVKIIGAGVVIMTMISFQISMADSESAMFNNIFDTTYQALKASTLITQTLLSKIFIIISTINVLAAVTPVFILIAICSTISIPVEEDVLNMEFFIKRMNYLNQGIMIGSMVMLFGIIHMDAWMQWPIAMFTESELKKIALNVFAAISQYWGISFTLLLVCLYASAAIYWQRQTRSALLAIKPDTEITEWLEDNGFTISWQKHALQLSSMLTPLLAGSFSAGKELLSLG